MSEVPSKGEGSSGIDPSVAEVGMKQSSLCDDHSSDDSSDGDGDHSSDGDHDHDEVSDGDDQDDEDNSSDFDVDDND